MACDISVQGVFGLGNPINRIRVTGTFDNVPDGMSRPVSVTA